MVGNLCALLPRSPNSPQLLCLLLTMHGAKENSGQSQGGTDQGQPQVRQPQSLVKRGKIPPVVALP
jgi:hypothetical protein